MAVSSSVIRRVAYGEALCRLTIHFVSGRVYAYADAPPAVATGLLAAPSHGGFFNVEVRDRFAAVRLR